MTKTGGSAQEPEPTNEHGAGHDHPKPCGAASTELGDADTEDGAGEQAVRPGRDHLLHELYH